MKRSDELTKNGLAALRSGNISGAGQVT